MPTEFTYRDKDRSQNSVNGNYDVSYCVILFIQLSQVSNLMKLLYISAL